MSYQATAWAYAQHVTPSGRKFVLVALANYADEAGSCYPGQEKLAEMTGQTVRSVSTHLQGLESDGLIERSHRYRATPDGGRTSDRYTLLMGQPEDSSGSGYLKPSEGLPEKNDGVTGKSFRGIVREPSVEPLVARKPSRRAPETPIPGDFQPTDNHRAMAKEHHLDLSSELMRFRTHAAANDRRLRNWNAGFTMWLSKAVELRPSRPAPRAANDQRPEAW